MPKNSQRTFSPKIGEANFKTAIFQEYFGTKKFGYMQELDRIDFIITDNADRHLIWAETKKNTADTVEMFAQLILTIGKARTFDRHNPPPFLCVFDYEKIAFLQYNAVHDIFYQNDFNWNIAPSDHKTKEFQQIKAVVESTVNERNLIFSFDNDKAILKEFIKNNFSESHELFPELFTRLQIDKNNFVPTYNRWVEMVKPSIAIDWNIAKRKGIIDGDFYLADLLSEDNVTLKDKLYVLLKKTSYELDRQIDEMGLFSSKSVSFKDGGLSHRHFWELYTRPPKEEYWDYIVDRRDLLVPQDVRERKGSFFTPQIWVQKSQEYMTKAFGENWQDEYHVWDCAAGTGNLLVGLTNKYNLWASTLDTQDVDVMKDRIKNGANLLESHVFQFDFLNDSFDKLPQGLKEIINDPEKRKKLIVYINPPYAESGNRATMTGRGENKANVSSETNVYDFFQKHVGTATRELFAQFFLRVYRELPNSKLASFGKLKYISAQNFIKFREYFMAEFKAGFICKADTFDNVIGKFPIGFLIWDLENKQEIIQVKTDILVNDDELTNCWYNGTKTFYSIKKNKLMVDWLRNYYDKVTEKIGWLRVNGPGFADNQGVFFTLGPTENDIVKHFIMNITGKNIIEMCTYLTVRHCVEHTWINDRDLFLYPNSDWENDYVFQNDCVIYSSFHGQNNISSKHGVNHWIPFTEQEVNARDNFQSHFMSGFLKGKTFSPEAHELLNSGKELWRYYHSKIKDNRAASVDASFYDIREYFQGRSPKGTMNQKSTDETYNALIKKLRQNLSVLAEKIKPKVYEYGFLME